MDVTYVGQSEGDFFAMYHLLDERDRPALEILVDPDNAIWISGVEGHGQRVPIHTGLFVHRHTDPLFELNGIDSSMICIGSIHEVVKPRIVTLMALAYCG